MVSVFGLSFDAEEEAFVFEFKFFFVFSCLDTAYQNIKRKLFENDYFFMKPIIHIFLKLCSFLIFYFLFKLFVFTMNYYLIIMLMAINLKTLFSPFFLKLLRYVEAFCKNRKYQICFHLRHYEHNFHFALHFHENSNFG